jgi:hypothetical protein
MWPHVALAATSNAEHRPPRPNIAPRLLPVLLPALRLRSDLAVLQAGTCQDLSRVGAPVAELSSAVVTRDRPSDCGRPCGRSCPAVPQLTGEGSLLGELVKAAPERALQSELPAHLGYTKSERPPYAGSTPRSSSSCPAAARRLGRVPAAAEALICRLRRDHPRWGACRIVHELGLCRVGPVPGRATVHRVLVRNGLVIPQEQHRRWERDAPMQLWQLDIVAGAPLADRRGPSWSPASCPGHQHGDVGGRIGG